jgi:hypothetical protein
MFDRAVRTLATAAKRTSPRYAAMLLASIFFACTWHMPGLHVEAPKKPPALKRAAALVPAEAGWMESLRGAAARGDQGANLELSIALLDRYDLAGDVDDLYEAMEWIDRRWDLSRHAELVQRVVQQYCVQRVVRWHRLCVFDE